MRFDQFTQALQQAFANAQSLAVGKDHTEITAAHLLQAMIDLSGGALTPLLLKAGADVRVLRQSLNSELDSFATLSNPTGDVSPSKDLIKVLNLADRMAQKRGDQFIASELVVLAIFAAKDRCASFLEKAGVKQSKFLDAVETLRGGQAVQDAGAEENREALGKYTIGCLFCGVRHVKYDT